MIECDEQASHGHVRYYGGLRHARRTTRSIRVVAWRPMRPGMLCFAPLVFSYT